MIVTLNGRAETIDGVKDLCYCIGLCTSQDNAKMLEDAIEVLFDEDKVDAEEAYDNIESFIIETIRTTDVILDAVDKIKASITKTGIKKKAFQKVLEEIDSEVYDLKQIAVMSNNGEYGYWR